MNCTEHTFDTRSDGKSGTCLTCHANIQPVFVSHTDESEPAMLKRTITWFAQWLAAKNIGVYYCTGCRSCFPSEGEYLTHVCAKNAMVAHA
jgi:hypothetical protein